MFNFLDPKLSPKIVCKSPAMDNYEIDNLISDNYTKKMRGFLAYSAIKPPVEIEVELICPINIYFISLDTTVGSQKCTGIEIFAKDSDLNYTSICKSIYDKAGIVFCNSKKYSATNLPPNFKSDYHLAFFKSNTFRTFLNTSAIKIVIFRTEKSVPCLGSIEICGTTSKSCSATTTNTINRIMRKSNFTVNCNILNVKSEEFKIPEDFKDDLTFEIMSIPMTLPSGKTVDQSTLEKHINSETSFGRKPCDPFTGLKFTDKIKPVVNVALKSRIDMFLLQHSHREELFNVKRTLGRAKVSSSCENPSKKLKIDNETDYLDKAILKAEQCSKCNIQLNILYEISYCQHRYCRSCLLEACETLKCFICNNFFVRNAVKKINM